MVVVVDDVSKPEIKSATGKIAGFDFGLKTLQNWSLAQTVQKLNHPNCSNSPSMQSTKLVEDTPNN